MKIRKKCVNCNFLSRLKMSSFLSDARVSDAVIEFPRKKCEAEETRFSNLALHKCRNHFVCSVGTLNLVYLQESRSCNGFLQLGLRLEKKTNKCEIVASFKAENGQKCKSLIPFSILLTVTKPENDQRFPIPPWLGALNQSATFNRNGKIEDRGLQIKDYQVIHMQSIRWSIMVEWRRLLGQIHFSSFQYPQLFSPGNKRNWRKKALLETGEIQSFQIFDTSNSWFKLWNRQCSEFRTPFSPGVSINLCPVGVAAKTFPFFHLFNYWFNRFACEWGSRKNEPYSLDGRETKFHRMDSTIEKKINGSRSQKIR